MISICPEVCLVMQMSTRQNGLADFDIEAQAIGLDCHSSFLLSYVSQIKSILRFGLKADRFSVYIDCLQDSGDLTDVGDWTRKVERYP